MKLNDLLEVTNVPMHARQEVVLGINSIFTDGQLSQLYMKCNERYKDTVVIAFKLVFLTGSGF